MIKSNYEYLIDILQEMVGEEVVVDNKGFIPMDIVVQAITTKAEEQGGTIKPQPITPPDDSDWTPPTEDNYTPIEGEYFYVRSVEDNNTIYFSDSEYRFSQWLPYLDYSYDQENWKPAIDLSNVKLNQNQKIYFKNNGSGKIPTINTSKGTIPSSKGIAIGGNAGLFYSADNQVVSLNTLKFTNHKNDDIYSDSDWFTKSNQKLITVDEYTDFTTTSTGGANLFLRNPWLLKINAENLRLTNGNMAFRRCRELKEIENLDCSGISDARYMFEECYALHTLPTLDFTKVTDFDRAFQRCWNIKTLTLNNLTRVKTFSQTFQQCRSLESIGGTFNTSNVTSLKNAFTDCYEFKGFTSGTFNTSNVTNMDGAFYYCTKLISLPDDFSTTSCKNMRQAFADCYALQYLPTLDFTNVTDANAVFWRCESIGKISLRNTQNIQDFSNAFYMNYAITEIDGTIDCSSAGSINAMFNECSSLNEISITNTSNVIEMREVFRCTGIVTVPSTFSTTSANYVDGLFSYCGNLQSIPILNFSNVITANDCFTGCNNLQNVTFEGSINVSLSFGNSPLLTYDSIKSILTAASQANNTDSKTLDLGGSTVTDNGGEIQALVDNCILKGWTINNLTIN